MIVINFYTRFNRRYMQLLLIFLDQQIQITPNLLGLSHLFSNSIH